MGKQAIAKFQEGVLKQVPVTEGVLTQSTEGSLWAYQRNYLFGLINALKRSYPSVLKVLGEQNFLFFAKTYVDQNPSQSSNIDDYGMSFPHHLRQREELVEHFYLEGLGLIDQWDQYGRCLQQPLQVPEGTLQLWKYLQADDEWPDIQIDEEVFETISLYQDAAGAYFVASPQENS